MITTITLYGLAAILARAVYVLQVPLFAEILTAEEFGYLDILSIGTLLVNFIVSVEIGQGVGICVAQAERSHKRTRYLSTAFLFSLMTYTLFLIIALSTSRYSAGLVLESVDHADIMVAWCLATAAQGVFLIAHNHLRWLLRPRPYFFVAIVYFFLAVSLSWHFGTFLEYRLTGIFYGQAAAALTGSVISLLFWRDMYIGRISLLALREMLRFSLPLVPSSIAVLVVLYVDRFFIKLLLSWGDLGAYAVAYRLASIMAIFPVAVNAALPPVLYSSAEDLGSKERIRRMFMVYVFVILVGTGLLILFSPWLLTVFGAGGYSQQAAVIVPILGAGVLASVLYNFAPGLVLARASRTIAIISIAVAVLSVPLTYFLIHIGGLIGAALAPLITSLITFGLWLYAGRTRYAVKLPLFKAFQYGAITSILYLLAIFGNANWKIHLVATTIAGLIFLGIRPLRELSIKLTGRYS